MRRIQQYLSRSRNELKGLAILWVVFSHARLGLGGFWGDVQRIGYGGVDIFFFLSGFGLWHSLCKDADMGRYLKRRAQRLLPAYLPFCVVWLCVMLPLYGFGTVQAVRTAMGNLFMIGFFADAPAMINWYVSALAVSLLLAPCAYALLAGARAPRRCALLLVAASFAMGLCFIGTETYMAVSRLPVFLLGMAAAMPAAEKPQSRVLLTGTGLAAFAAGIAALQLCFARFPQALNDYGMYWHPFVLVAPALCAGLGWFFFKTQRFGKAFLPLRVLGKASFEIFLFNAWIEVLGKRFGLMQTPFAWALWSVGSILAGCLYHWVVAACIKRVAARRHPAVLHEKEQETP